MGKDNEADSADEIEITSEMIEAGAAAIIEMAGDIIPPVGGEAADLARACYLAMSRVAVLRKSAASKR
jgi:hypothetical protein